MPKRYIFFLFVLSSSLSCRDSRTENESYSTIQLEELDIPKEDKEEIPALEAQVLSQGLIHVRDVDSTLLVDLKYASSDNFFGRNVYQAFKRAYLQQKVAEDLALAHTYLKEIHPSYRFYIFDAVRPLAIQRILWDALDTIPPAIRSQYVANPAEGSIHNFGCAVDLSIFDLEADTLLDMGTNFDHFGELAYPRKELEMLAQGRLTPKQITNRALLRDVLGKFGFMPITSEWWHFNRYSRASASQKYAIVE